MHDAILTKINMVIFFVGLSMFMKINEMYFQYWVLAIQWVPDELFTIICFKPDACPLYDIIA